MYIYIPSAGQPFYAMELYFEIVLLATYLSSSVPASIALALMHAHCRHIMQGVLTQVTPLATATMGIGPFLTLASGLVFGASAVAIFVIWRRLHAGALHTC